MKEHAREGEVAVVCVCGGGTWWLFMLNGFFWA